MIISLYNIYDTIIRFSLYIIQHSEMKNEESFQLSQLSDRGRNSLQAIENQDEQDIPAMQQIKVISHDQNFNLKFLLFIIIGIIIMLASLHYYGSKKDIDHSPFNEQSKNHKFNNETYEINHDQTCFTQGLSFINETHLLETCGLYSLSYFHIYEVSQDEITLKLSLVETYRSFLFQPKYFLQGGIYFPKINKFLMLTWNQQVIFVYSKQLQLQEKFKWQGQGWGITHNNSHLFISNGSQYLMVVNQNLKIVQTIKVMDFNGFPINKINELQWIEQDNKQYILANIFLEKIIVKIDLSTGYIIKQFDFSFLTLQYNSYSQKVLNGIAYHSATNQYLVTGKKWKQIYLMCNLGLNA